MYSDCCGVEGGAEYIDFGICPACHEHCTFYGEEDAEEVETNRE